MKLKESKERKFMRGKSSASYDIYASPVGTLYLIFSGRSLTGIAFKKPPQIAFKKGSAPGTFLNELKDYFRGMNNGFNQKIKFLEGTDFEKKVW